MAWLLNVKSVEMLWVWFYQINNMMTTIEELRKTSLEHLQEIKFTLSISNTIITTKIKWVEENHKTNVLELLHLKQRIRTNTDDLNLVNKLIEQKKLLENI